MGVITTVTLSSGRVYGPIPPHVTLTDPMLMIGHMTTDTRPDVHTVKVNPESFHTGGDLAEWVPYVQAARDEREQNVEAVLKDGQLYYRVLCQVPAGSELMVWYSADLAQIIGVPDLHASYIKDGGSFCCPYCRKWFRFPNCLRAHMRFKCESSRHIYCTSTTTKATTNLKLSVPTPIYHNSSPPPASYCSSASPPRTTHEDRLSEGGISPGSTSSGVSSASMSPPNSAEKRKREDDDEEDPIISSKKFLSQDIRLNISPDSDSKFSKSPSPQSGVEDNISAFHKVERSIPLSAYTKSSSPVSMNNNNVTTSSAQASFPVINNPYGLAGLLRPPVVSGFPSPRPANPPTSHNNVSTHFPVTLADITRLANGLPVRARIPGMDAIATSGKIPFHPDWRYHFPYYKSQNPIVESILSSATSGTPAFQSMPMQLMQNWCAKCNATFRMTSDLVYHMRSHHKTEFEKKVEQTKQEGKLECHVCGERFRERHHLTRHMTSH